MGYKGYSSLIASENNFYIVRCFGALNARIALVLQGQVSVLEEELEALDGRYIGLMPRACTMDRFGMTERIEQLWWRRLLRS